MQLYLIHTLLAFGIVLKPEMVLHHLSQYQFLALKVVSLGIARSAGGKLAA